MLSSTCYFNTRQGFLNLKTVSQQPLSFIFWCISAEALRTFWKARSRRLPGSRGWGWLAHVHSAGRDRCPEGPHHPLRSGHNSWLPPLPHGVPVAASLVTPTPKRTTPVTCLLARAPQHPPTAGMAVHASAARPCHFPGSTHLPARAPPVTGGGWVQTCRMLSPAYYTVPRRDNGGLTGLRDAGPRNTGADVPGTDHGLQEAALQS